MIGDDFTVLENSVSEDGVRHIIAAPSALVCSRQVELDIVDGKIHNLRYTGGCHGNLQAIGALLEGQSLDFAFERLSGINCKGRGTSCSDQLIRILRSLYI